MNSAAIDIFQYEMTMVGMINLLIVSAMLKIQGAGYLGISLAFLTVCLSFHAIWLSATVTRYVRGRNARGQYKSSEKFLKGALLYSLVTGAIWCVFLGFLGNRLGSILVRDVHIGICLMAAGPILLINAVSESIGGYLKGMGIFRPVRIFLLVRQIAVFAASIAGIKLFLEYGEKVSKLLHNSAVTYVYGAFGAMLGVLFGYLIGLLVLCVFCLLLHGELRRMKNQDTSRYQETVMHGFRTIFGTGIFQGLKWGLLMAPLPINYILYVRLCKKDIDSTSWIRTGGFLFGEAVPVMALLILGFVILNYKNHRQLAFHLKSEAYGQLRERICAMLLGACVLALPVCAAFGAMSEPILKLLSKETSAEGSSIFLWACVGAVLIIVEIIMMKLLQLWNETIYGILATLISFAVQTIFVTAAFQAMNLGVPGILFGMLLQALLFIILSFVKVGRRMRLSGYFLKKLIMCIIVALASTLIIVLLYELLGKILPVGAALPLSVIPGFLLYFAALSLLRLISNEEAMYMPGGALFLQLNRVLHRE